MGRLLLVRHAESEGNRDGVFTATPHVPLTARGHEQARMAGQWIRGRHVPTRVVTSPFTRARQTAAIIASELDCPVAVEDDLQERSYGALAGLPYATPRPDYDRARYWEWRPQEGETLIEVAARVGAVLDRLAAATPDGDLVVVSHGAVMMAAQWHVTGTWPPAGRVVRNAGILVVDHHGGQYLGLCEVPGDETGPVG